MRARNVSDSTQLGEKYVQWENSYRARMHYKHTILNKVQMASFRIVLITPIVMCYCVNFNNIIMYRVSGEFSRSIDLS